MNEPLLHVTFSSSGYGTLRMALLKAGRNEEIISLMDFLGFGPIDTSNFRDRQVWVKRELGIEEDWVEEETRAFWEKVISDTRPKVLWTSRRSVGEYTGFLECLWRLGDTPCSVVDLTEVKVVARGRDGNLRPPELGICLPLLSDETILRNGILDTAQPLTVEERARYHALWKRLRAENAPFRVVSEQGIASAPITYFDDHVLSCVKSHWQKSARVIGEAMGQDFSTNYYQVGDLVYFSRLQSLAERGSVESRGDMSKMRSSEVRLPQEQTDKPVIGKT